MEIPQRLAELVGFISIQRVCGELSLTRAIGDAEYKGKIILCNGYLKNK